MKGFLAQSRYGGGGLDPTKLHKALPVDWGLGGRKLGGEWDEGREDELLLVCEIKKKLLNKKESVK